MTDSTETTDAAADAGGPGRRINGFDLTSMHDALTDWRGLDSFLQELTEQAVRAVGSADSCSVTMRRNGRLLTTASSDATALTLDAMQYEVESGPCVCSLREGVEQYAADTLDEDRWGPYPGLAAGQGVRSVFAAPLSVQGRPPSTVPDAEARPHTVGALNLYARAPGAFEGSQEVVRRFAEQAAGAVAVAERIEKETEAARDLRAAMESRFVIDQAIGIVMARRRCPAETALGVLRRASQGRNIKLRELCYELVLQTGGRPPEPGHFTRRD
ncbi:transcription antitermination regulator [Streptomyces spiroverticillatus]|uniref:Transcription antitermination regulator n=1 Tax=Streptomyces finlayi TaxID=67296 RepID=A0A919C934_9ACTN|nr:GAF and ANTAR domain-containing protein [Streptomyces finlayi]GHA00007.1 transcription antitermination regulator [Streptomyces spiroverticillatus]GHC84572.1 transcription antitermination regulator [Streptomyces finlayi]